MGVEGACEAEKRGGERDMAERQEEVEEEMG